MILVTGGTGILGMRLLYDLCKEVEPVKAIKRKQTNINLVKEVFSFYGDSDGKLFKSVNWIDGNILDIVSLETAISECETVYHCAALVSFNPQENSRMYKTNVEGTANVVNICLDKKIKKLCYVSSVAAIGRVKNGDCITEQTKWKSNPLNSNYAISKYLAEREVWRGIEEGLKAVIVNPTIILGAAQNNNSSGNIITNLKRGSPFYTTGSNGFVDVGNVSETMIQLMKSNIVSERFILVGENLSYKGFLTQGAEIFKVKKPTYKASNWMLEIAWRVAKVISIITGVKPLFTKETLRTSTKSYFYSNEKIKNNLSIAFISVKDSLDYYSKFYLEK
jgi:dihydroflavonol-4-reductase